MHIMHAAIADVGGKCLDAASIATSTAPDGRQDIRRQKLPVDRGCVASGDRLTFFPDLKAPLQTCATWL